jgi:hypothetical protein
MTTPGKPFNSPTKTVKLNAASTLACASMLWAGVVSGAEVHSIHVDRVGEKILVQGSGFDSGTSFTLGGVAVPAADVTGSELSIPFGTEVYAAVQWEASYSLIVDGTDNISVYIAAPIMDSPPPPSPPPEPPPGGPDCPCIAGWLASGIPQDNFSWCYYGQDNNQLWMYATRDSFSISSAFDPTNIFFDPVEPGNSVSYCVLIDNGSYTVAEPVVNIDQYSDCELWMWRKICI